MILASRAALLTIVSVLNDAFFFVVADEDDAAPDVLRAEPLSPLLAGGPDLTPEEESTEDDNVS